MIEACISTRHACIIDVSARHCLNIIPIILEYDPCILVYIKLALLGVIDLDSHEVLLSNELICHRVIVAQPLGNLSLPINWVFNLIQQKNWKSYECG